MSRTWWPTYSSLSAPFCWHLIMVLDSGLASVRVPSLHVLAVDLSPGSFPNHLCQYSELLSTDQ